MGKDSLATTRENAQKKGAPSGVLRAPTPKMPCKSHADDTPYIRRNFDFQTEFNRSERSKPYDSTVYYIVKALLEGIRTILILLGEIPDWGVGINLRAR
jgi:hypothetical protein